MSAEAKLAAMETGSFLPKMAQAFLPLFRKTIVCKANDRCGADWESSSVQL